jgi:tetratricopeptide (TPR) repeat protein
MERPAVPSDRLPPDPENRDSAYELFRRGSQLLERNHPGPASVLLERAARREPGKASILEALGRAYYNQGQPERAAESFRAIVDRDPLAHYSHFGLGLSSRRLGDVVGARRHLKMAVFLRPEIDDYRRALERLGSVA